MNLLEVSVPMISGFITAVFVGWLMSASMDSGRTDQDGITHLELTTAIHAYGALMGAGFVAGLTAIGFAFFSDAHTAIALVGCAAIFLPICGWGLYAGYGGKLSYSADGIYYNGIKAKRFAKWAEISEIRIGSYGQYITIDQDRFILPDALRGYPDFVEVARSHGVSIVTLES